VGSVVHPAFVESLSRRGLLRRGPEGALTMPGAGGLRLPVVRRAVGDYAAALARGGFRCDFEDVFATAEVLRARPGLREAGNVPLALVLDCAKVHADRQENRA
jgi:hypothetical protein